jgi:putative cardiolipin synthase
MLDHFRFALIVFFISLILCGCATLPPGGDVPKSVSTAIDHPELTNLGLLFGIEADAHPGNSGFRLIPAGVDGFQLRMQMINAAERSLDLQYYIFHSDETGNLLTEAVLQAADRGVRVRVLVDDAETLAGDEQLSLLDAHPKIEIRIFNPFAYRGHAQLLRSLEFMFNASRLDYRMHNKLLVVDNAIALIGGRNIGDQFFQIDPESQFADDDVFVAGPMSRQLSSSFDEFWNCDMSIPNENLAGGESSPSALNARREILHRQNLQLQSAGNATLQPGASSLALRGIMAGHSPLIWAPAQLVYDSPDKNQVENTGKIGRLMQRLIADAEREVKMELLMITPYLVPGREGMQLLENLRQRQVHIRVLTNSLS